MTTELAIADSFAPVPLTTSILEDLKQQAETLHAAHTVAEWLCGTGFAPEAYRNKPKEGAVAILFGARLGLDAVQSLQNVFNVYGVPSTYAKVMKAALLAAGHEIWTVEKSATRCVVRGRRRGSDPTLPPEESVWDTERVKKAGYDKRNQKYNTEPENMLYARATAECCRAVAPDVLLGIDVDIEEVRDRGRESVRVESERVPAAEILAAPTVAAAPKVQQWQAPAEDGSGAASGDAAASEPSAKPDTAEVAAPAEPVQREPEEAATEQAAGAPRETPPTDQQIKELKSALVREGLKTARQQVEYLRTQFNRATLGAIFDLTGEECAKLTHFLMTAPQGAEAAASEQLPIASEGGK